jgi:phage recombination protein Bet
MSKALSVQSEYSETDLQLIKDTIAKNATTPELNLFLTRAKALGLNPLKPGLIYFIKYGSGAGTIVVGLDGFRSLASRTGLHKGTKRGVLRDEKGKPIGGWAEVYRDGWEIPARVEVSMAEYAKSGGNWGSMPETMIQKVAECGALRMAFPDSLGGVYGEDERIVTETTQKAQSSVPFEVVHEKPAFETVIEEHMPLTLASDPPQQEKKLLSAYVMKTGGNRKGKMLSLFTKERLNAFISDVDKLVEEGKSVSEEVQDDCNATLEYLNASNGN